MGPILVGLDPYEMGWGGETLFSSPLAFRHGGGMVRDDEPLLAVPPIDKAIAGFHGLAFGGHGECV